MPKRHYKKSKKAPELTQSTTNVRDLPTEIWIEIFRNLTKAQLKGVRHVSHSWQDMILRVVKDQRRDKLLQHGDEFYDMEDIRRVHEMHARLFHFSKVIRSFLTRMGEGDYKYLITPRHTWTHLQRLQCLRNVSNEYGKARKFLSISSSLKKFVHPVCFKVSRKSDAGNLYVQAFYDTVAYDEIERSHIFPICLGRDHIDYRKLVDDNRGKTFRLEPRKKTVRVYNIVKGGWIRDGSKYPKFSRKYHMTIIKKQDWKGYDLDKFEETCREFVNKLS